MCLAPKYHVLTHLFHYSYVVMSVQAKTAAEVDFLRKIEDAMDDTVNNASKHVRAKRSSLVPAKDKHHLKN